MLIRHQYYTVYMLFVATRNISENNAPLLNDQHGRALSQKPMSQTSCREIFNFGKPLLAFFLYTVSLPPSFSRFETKIKFHSKYISPCG